MFWTFIRWGGTAIVTLLLLAAVLLSAGPAEITAPAAAETPPTKNFNL